jgi:hypothetical protein
MVPSSLFAATMAWRWATLPFPGHSFERSSERNHTLPLRDPMTCSNLTSRPTLGVEPGRTRSASTLWRHRA